MKQKFTKKIFTAKLFFQELGFLIVNLISIVKLVTNKKKNNHLYEKIFIITDAVNGCIYCSWLDAKLAIKSGMPKNEIKNMLKLQFSTDSSAYELNALLYTQHFTESNGNPDAEMTKKLFEYYGKEMAENIVLAIRAVTFGNLYFNTWRAIVSRFKGNPAPNSSVFFEIFYFSLNFLIILPFIILRKLDSKAIGLT